MKRKTKILTLISLTLVICAALSLSAFASEPESAADASENIFTTVYGVISENADKVFSALAFVGAIIIGFAYKRGLFPFVEKALGSIAGAVGSLREATEKSSAENSGFIEEMAKQLAFSEEILKGFSEKLRALEEKLDTAALIKDENESFRAVMLSEVEMIYEIFVTSSLPQYQKDRVGEAYSKMKAALTGKEG